MLSKDQFSELYTLIDTEQLTVSNDVENEVWNDIRRGLRKYESEDDYISLDTQVTLNIFENFHFVLCEVSLLENSHSFYCRISVS